MIQRHSPLKCRIFDRSAIKPVLLIIGLGVIFFVLHTNLYVILFYDSGPFLKSFAQVYAADITPFGEQMRSHASEWPSFERRLDGYEFIVGVLLTSLGLMAIVLACLRWKKKDLLLLSFGAFCLLWGARTNLFLFLFEPSDRFWEYARWFLTYLVPIPGLIFGEQLLGKGWKSSIRRLWQIAIIIAVISIAYGIYSARPWAGFRVNSFLVIDYEAAVL